MFRTTKCSSSGRLVHTVVWYFFIYPYKQSGRWQEVSDVKNTAECSSFYVSLLLLWRVLVAGEKARFSTPNALQYAFRHARQLRESACLVIHVSLFWLTEQHSRYQLLEQLMPIVTNWIDEIGEPLFEVTDILQLDMSKRQFLPDITFFYSLLSSCSACLAYHFTQIFQLCKQIPEAGHPLPFLVECCELFLIRALLQLDSLCVQMFSVCCS